MARYTGGCLCGALRYEATENRRTKVTAIVRIAARRPALDSFPSCHFPEAP
jgi:hypothetical protein